MLNETLVVNELPTEDSIFKNHKGEYKKGIKKRQTKLLKKLSFLTKFLIEDEKIMFVAQGCSPMNFFERFFGGAFIVSQKECLLVFTNIRILHIPTTFFAGKYRNSLSQILYADCESINKKLRSLEIKYKNGKKEKFSYIPRKDRKKIVSFVSQINFSLHEPIFSMRNHLCPECTIELQKDIYECQACGQEFKSKKENWKISAIYPGGGYFYTGQYLAGFVDALVEILLSYLVIAGIIQYLSGQQKLIGPIVFIAIALVVEKFFTVYHTSANIEEYLPVRTKRKVNDLLFYCIFPILIYGLAFAGLYQTNYDKDAYQNESNQVAYPEIDNAIDSGDYDRAIQLIEGTKKDTFVQEEIFQLDSTLVYIYEALGQYDKAAASCGDCLKNIEKSSDKYYTYRGRQKLFLGDIISAIKDFNASMSMLTFAIL